ncbi:hypothetical protein BMVs3gp2 [Brome mosaic virus]|uniref:Capsid protein n=3 Tax=Brome mosaic virus TaxID=12302 RepID=CAPSD_BMV|nr:hypothetical protein BMVs3gp2 [Brome mosaic virus]P03602.1 RecName: Full=Capsid protein; Short=CP; AltName: Full=Coat protein [Brome mosaic virus]1JS9_A Chain A, Coat protein [Brome mosaic virus]1JS9_B Chain B, Coat protein [Brome mosaic virus]1JS9_C Chain C, Coat protein [Brome mosaic virus]3J7L_A Chain A, Capsid protein [Brome mosaic virus]3J7L_B Chain B, Capsid protein [Brome mosaic virus]3J7L_C Chain C, Capsid protein [Brome mosaic virus]3J7M_A Chain A, Capsid protein [Brome mosaic v
MSTSGTGKMTRAQRRAAARRNRWTARVQPVIVEPLAAGQGKAIKAIAGYSISKWEASSDAITAKATNAMSITLPHELSSEKNKELKVGRVLLWLGLLPSVAGRIKACVAEKQAQAEAAFQVALAVADSSKEVVAAMYTDAFRGATLGDLLNLQIYLYASEAVPAKAVVVHLEVEHVRPTFDDFFTPVYR